MKFFKLILFTSIFIYLFSSFSFAATATSTASPFKLIEGPKNVNVGTMATLDLTDKYLFADKANTALAMKEFGNTSSPYDIGSVYPKNEDEGWFIIFTYNDEGYIKDEDKNIDAKELLTTMQENQDLDNKDREKKGYPKLSILGWQEEPNYNQTFHSLVWGLKISESDQKESDTVNYNSRILYRKGYISANLVCSTKELDKAKGDLKTIIEKFKFNDGEKYSDFKSGDKVSEFGLAALIAGGAIATKKGLLVLILAFAKKLWFLILLPFAFLKKLFSKKKENPYQDNTQNDSTESSNDDDYRKDDYK